jgi:NADPH:quinone reductase-like Zn-dependent oxidoreductase
VATTTSKKNFDLVKSMGADVIIDYTSENFRNVLNGYDVVFDTLGRKVLEDSLYVLRPGGLVVTIAGVPDAEFARQRGSNVAVRLIYAALGAKVRRLSKKLATRYRFVLAASRGDELAEIAELIDDKKIQPVIDRIFPFDQIKDALLYLQQGRAKGKVIAQVK